MTPVCEQATIYCEFREYYWHALCHFKGAGYETNIHTCSSPLQAANDVLAQIRKDHGASVTMRRLGTKIFEVSVPISNPNQGAAMPSKKRTEEKPPETNVAEAIRAKIMALVDSVLTRNMSDIETVRGRLLAFEEPEEMSIALAIKLSAEHVPSASVKLTYSERYTDSVSAPVEDPAQGKLSLP